jgi:hypothetical protein
MPMMAAQTAARKASVDALMTAPNLNANIWLAGQRTAEVAEGPQLLSEKDSVEERTSMPVVNSVQLTREAEATVRDGFGPAGIGEDAFDAFAGLIKMMRSWMAGGRKPPHMRLMRWLGRVGFKGAESPKQIAEASAPERRRLLLLRRNGPRTDPGVLPGLVPETGPISAVRAERHMRVSILRFANFKKN